MIDPTYLNGLIVEADRYAGTENCGNGVWEPVSKYCPGEKVVCSRYFFRHVPRLKLDRFIKDEHVSISSMDVRLFLSLNDR